MKPAIVCKNLALGQKRALGMVDITDNMMPLITSASLDGKMNVSIEVNESSEEYRTGVIMYLRHFGYTTNVVDKVVNGNVVGTTFEIDWSNATE